MRSLITGLALLAAGVAAILVGEYPVQDAFAMLDRVWPVLLFVVAITVVAELAAEAGLFDVVGAWTTRIARGSTWLLWLLTVAVAIVSTVFLSLDTTAVMLTPIVITTARRVGVNPMPFALTTVMLANCASMLLPVSNLTNLLAEQSLGGVGAAGFVALSWAPALVAIVVPVGAIAFLGRRSLAGRYVLPESMGRPDRPLVIWAAVVLLALLPALVTGIPVWIPASAAAVVLVVVFLVVRRSVVRVTLVPWQTVVLAVGLFVAMGAVNALGLTELLGRLAGTGTAMGPVELLRTSALGLVGANAANNLPAYLALEPVARHPLQLMALLVGVNAGALITPWASFATLLWHGRLARVGIEVPWGRYLRIGLVVAPVTVIAATGALALAH